MILLVRFLTEILSPRERQNIFHFLKTMKYWVFLEILRTFFYSLSCHFDKALCPTFFLSVLVSSHLFPTNALVVVFLHGAQMFFPLNSLVIFQVVSQSKCFHVCILLPSADTFSFCTNNLLLSFRLREIMSHTTDAGFPLRFLGSGTHGRQAIPPSCLLLISNNVDVLFFHSCFSLLSFLILLYSFPLLSTFFVLVAHM